MCLGETGRGGNKITRMSSPKGSPKSSLCIRFLLRLSVHCGTVNISPLLLVIRPRAFYQPQVMPSLPPGWLSPPLALTATSMPLLTHFLPGSCQHPLNYVFLGSLSSCTWVVSLSNLFSNFQICLPTGGPSLNTVSSPTSHVQVTV